MKAKDAIKWLEMMPDDTEVTITIDDFISNNKHTFEKSPNNKVIDGYQYYDYHK